MCRACQGVFTPFKHFTTVYKSALQVRRAVAVKSGNTADRIAAELAALLISTYDEQKKAAISDLQALLNSPNSFTETDLEALLELLRRFLSDNLTSAVYDQLKQAHETLYTAGVRSILGGAPVFNLVNQTAIDWLQNHQIFWVKNHFDKHLAGLVSGAASEAIRKGMSRRDAANFFLQQFKDKYDVASYRYWEGFANHVTTRAIEAGHLEGYTKAGIKFLRIVAILDHRTSEVCQRMNNRIVPVADAQKLYDLLAKSANPEDVKKVAPFLKPADMAGKTTKQLAKMSPGYAMPPFHFDCRSTTVAYFPPEKPIQFEGGKSASTHEEVTQFAESFTEEEMQLWFQEFRGKSGAMRYDPKDLQSDLKKHGQEWGVKKGHELTKIGRKLVKNANHVAFQEYKGEIQVKFFTKDGYAVTDLTGAIRGVYKHSDGLKAFEKLGKKNTYWYILK